MRRLPAAAASWVDRITGWRTLVIWLLAIFALSSIPNNFQQSDSPIPADKIAHGIEFAVLGVIVAGMLRRRMARRARVSIVAVAVLLSTLYGVSDELHQRFVPRRDVSAADLAADIAGALAGAAIAVALPISRRAL